mgnify:CR=1 FL=1
MRILAYICWWLALGFAAHWLADLLRVGSPVAGAVLLGGATP